jgi:hypothetical protein
MHGIILLFSFLYIIKNHSFSGLVVKLAVAILRFDSNLRATSASPVFDSRLMQFIFAF